MNPQTSSRARKGGRESLSAKMHKNDSIIPNLPFGKFWYRAQLFPSGSYTAVPTLRLLGIAVATECVNFSLIKV